MADLLSRARFLVLRTPVRLALFVLVAWIAGTEIIDDAGGMNVFHDAQFLSAYERNARISVLDFGEFPFWDPFSCGGLYGLAAPQTRYASPFFSLSLAFGVDRGAALAAVLWLVVSMEGMFRYARSWGATGLAALLCAPLFPLIGFLGGSWHYGWLQFFSFGGLPWILYGLRRALRGDARGAFLCGLANALTIGFGATWTLPIGAPLSACELVSAFARRDARVRLRRGLPMLAAACAWLATLAAFRFWPMLESARATLRVMAGAPQNSLASALRQLFVWSDRFDPITGAYYVAPLVVLGLVVWRRHHAWVLWLAALGTFALSLGVVTEWAPFSLLRKLPIYDTIRYPERFLITTVLVLSLLAALGVSTLEARARKRWKKRGARGLLAPVALLALVGLAAQIHNFRVRSVADIEPSPGAHFTSFRQSRGNRWLMSHFASEGMGSLGCGEAYPLPMSRHLRGDLAQEEYLVHDEQGPAGSVRRAAWSPNALTLEVDATRPARLAINQNYHPGWHSDVGTVESWDGLLSVQVPAGQSRVTLHFRPRSGIGGLVVSALALLLGAVWLKRRGLGARVRGALPFAPAGAWAVIALVWPEPAWTHPAPHTPDGEPALIDALPADATPLAVKFAVPLRLEGVRVAQSDPAHVGQVVDVDFFLRRTGTLSPALGFFVHMVGPGHRSVHADHAELSGTAYLMRLPVDQLARDRFRVAVPHAPGAWTMRMGLWNQYGDGQRIAVSEAGTTPVDNDALEVIRFTLE